MDSTELVNWLIEKKRMNIRSAKDVLSRCGRIYRMLGVNQLNDKSLDALVQNEQFKESSKFVKSQLKRTIALCLEFASESKKIDRANEKCINANRYNIIDLFAGVGGLSYGFSKLPQFNILVANEIEKDISIAYKLNHPNTEMLNCDINDLTEEALNAVLNGRRIDVVIGGPPCQSYSTLGKRQIDERANLFLQYKRVLGILQPKAFVFENVVGILSIDKGRLFKQVQSEFKELGYTLRYQVLNAVSFGVPQHRERVILVGFKGANNFAYPTPTHGESLKPYVTLKDAIGDLPPLKSGETKNTYASDITNEFLEFVRENSNDYVEEHSAPKNGERLIEIMETLKDGQTKDDLPEEIRPKSGYGNTYAKLWWNKPSTTITRNFACPSSSRCIHPRDSRAMSIREGARLQSFPDNYKFYGSDGTKRLEIGNAVPPLLSMFIAKQLLLALEEYQ